MKKRILLIDNDKELNKINEKILSSAGVASELHMATNGQDALNYLNFRIDKNYPLPEVIILELNLPVMDGFTFMEEFRKQNFVGKSKIAIVVFTASSNPRDKHKAIAMGARFYLNKPYILRGLKDIILQLDTEPANHVSRVTTIL